MSRTGVKRRVKQQICQRKIDEVKEHDELYGRRNLVETLITRKKKQQKMLPLLRRNKGRANNTGPNAIHSRDVQVPAGLNKGGKTAALQQQPIDAGWGGRSSRASANKAVESSDIKPNKKAERALHPSWEAKRRLKEKESVGIVPSQGTKIKFS